MEKNIIYINDINAPELDVYARLTEPRLTHIYEPDKGLFIAESPNVILRALDAGYEPESLLLEDKSIEKDAAEVISRVGDIPIYAANIDVLSKITGFKLTRGLLCAMKRKDNTDYNELLQNSKNIAVLEGVVNPTNIGAIFRSAAALNVDSIILSPDCADPLYRRAARVSMGTVFQIRWTYMGKNINNWYDEGLDTIHKYGFTSIGMALSDNSISIKEPILQSYDKKAVILGSEGYGLHKTTLEKCNHLCIIPMSNNVDSLNVAAASAVTFWELLSH